jgi:hypothetical protein
LAFRITSPLVSASARGERGELDDTFADVAPLCRKTPDRIEQKRDFVNELAGLVAAARILESRGVRGDRLVDQFDTLEVAEAIPLRPLPFESLNVPAKLGGRAVSADHCDRNFRGLLSSSARLRC